MTPHALLRTRVAIVEQKLSSGDPDDPPNRHLQLRPPTFSVYEERMHAWMAMPDGIQRMA